MWKVLVLVDDGASALALARKMGGGAQGLNCVATIQGSCLVLQG